MIRQFRFPDDLPQVLALWGQSGPGVRLGRSDTPGEIAKKFQRDPELFLVDDDDGRIIGTVIGGFDGRRGLVYHLAVAPSNRRQGIGKALMQELENRLRNKGCHRSYLLVVRENLDAIHFYERHGWQRMEHVFVYGKDLD